METKPEYVRYEECPFCDRVFIDRSYVGNGLRRISLEDGLAEMYDRIRTDHNKVWVRKGKHGRWVDIRSINKQVIAPSVDMRN
jgi:hypothetical protein